MLYSDNTYYWHKIGQLKVVGHEHFPFGIFQIDIMGYYRDINMIRYVFQVGIYDRGTFTRRINAIPVFRQGNGIINIAVDDELNIWVQIVSKYGGGYVLTYIGDRDFDRNYALGDYAGGGVASGFTALTIVPCNSTVVSQTF